MRRGNKKVTYNASRGATLSTGRWRRFGVLSVIVAGTAMVSPAQAQDVPRYSVLYTFTGGADGGYPVGGLIRGRSRRPVRHDLCRGNTGCYVGCGVVFKLAPAGQETVLYTFSCGLTVHNLSPVWSETQTATSTARPLTVAIQAAYVPLAHLRAEWSSSSSRQAKRQCCMPSAAERTGGTCPPQKFPQVVHCQIPLINPWPSLGHSSGPRREVASSSIQSSSV
jgi:hypothetical protein